jgi:hypothetical protein
MTAPLVSLVKARHAASLAADLAAKQAPAGTQERRDALKAAIHASRDLRYAWNALWAADPRAAARLGDEMYPRNS